MRHTSLFHQMASKFNHGRVLLSVLTVGMVMWSSMSNFIYLFIYLILHLVRTVFCKTHLFGLSFNEG